MAVSAQVEELYRRYAPSVQRRAQAILGNAEDARDVVHEVFMKALGAAAPFEGDQSPMTWLYRVTTNHCIDVLRVRGRRAELLANEGRALHGEARDGDGEARALLSAVLARVPDDIKEAAIGFYVDEMTQDELAQHLGCSRRTVGYRLERFRQIAQTLVAEHAL